MPRLAAATTRIRTIAIAAVTLGQATGVVAATNASPEVAARHGDTGVTRPDPAVVLPHKVRRLVFSCFAPGLVIFSDRPCGPLAAQRELRIDAPPLQGGRGASVTPEPAQSSTRLAVAARSAIAEPVDTEPGVSTCERLEDAVATLDARMRRGYSAKEAGRLWDSWREAKTRLHEAHC